MGEESGEVGRAMDGAARGGGAAGQEGKAKRKAGKER